MSYTRPRPYAVFDSGDTNEELIDAPHELLGLSPTESDPAMIVEAAQRRLRMLRNGHEYTVRRELSAMIRQARDQMVRSVIQSFRARASAPTGRR
jgi:hypothetical protein